MNARNDTNSGSFHPLSSLACVNFFLYLEEVRLSSEFDTASIEMLTGTTHYVSLKMLTL